MKISIEIEVKEDDFKGVFTARQEACFKICQVGKEIDFALPNGITEDFIRINGNIVGKWQVTP
jgi:hypothetical protein